jgi:hypothetical protein
MTRLALLIILIFFSIISSARPFRFFAGVSLYGYSVQQLAPEKKPPLHMMFKASYQVYQVELGISLNGGWSVGQQDIFINWRPKTDARQYFYGGLNIGSAIIHLNDGRAQGTVYGMQFGLCRRLRPRTDFVIETGFKTGRVQRTGYRGHGIPEGTSGSVVYVPLSVGFSFRF